MVPPNNCSLFTRVWAATLVAACARVPGAAAAGGGGGAAGVLAPPNNAPVLASSNQWPILDSVKHDSDQRRNHDHEDSTDQKTEAHSPLAADGGAQTGERTRNSGFEVAATAAPPSEVKLRTVRESRQRYR
jgi:hypothetical protein